jgi:hypothetical protein
MRYKLGSIWLTILIGFFSLNAVCERVLGGLGISEIVETTEIKIINNSEYNFATIYLVQPDCVCTSDCLISKIYAVPSFAESEVIELTNIQYVNTTAELVAWIEYTTGTVTKPDFVKNPITTTAATTTTETSLTETSIETPDIETSCMFYSPLEQSPFPNLDNVLTTTTAATESTTTAETQSSTGTETSTFTVPSVTSSTTGTLDTSSTYTFPTNVMLFPTNAATPGKFENYRFIIHKDMRNHLKFDEFNL